MGKECPGKYLTCLGGCGWVGVPCTNLGREEISDTINSQDTVK